MWSQGIKMIPVAPDEKIVTSFLEVWMGQAPADEPLALLHITLASSLFLVGWSDRDVIPNTQRLIKCNVVCIIIETKYNIFLFIGKMSFNMNISRLKSENNIALDGGVV